MFSRRRGKRIGQMLLCYSKTIGLIIFYYCCSIGLTFYQKNLIGEFEFPLTMVMIHLFLKFVLAGFCRYIYSCYTGVSRISISWNLYWKKVIPPGASASLDIGLSQWALKLIPVALYTMSKSTALLFILVFAILFKLEEMRWTVVMLIILITSGLLMFTYKYTQFNVFGFSLVISASLLSGVRWTLSQMVMQKAEMGLSNPIDMVYHIQPWMSIALLPLTVGVEGVSLATSRYGFRMNYNVDVLWIWFRVLTGAFLAFMMEISEYLVICYTSSLTFSISGVVKEIATLLLAVYYDNEHLSAINQLGLALCVVGITMHVIFKARHTSKMRPRLDSTESSEIYDMLPLLSDDDEIYKR